MRSRHIIAVRRIHLSADTGKIGEAAVILGAGREKKDDKIDMAAGIVLRKKPAKELIRATLWQRFTPPAKQGQTVPKSCI